MARHDIPLWFTDCLVAVLAGTLTAVVFRLASPVVVLLVSFIANG